MSSHSQAAGRGARRLKENRNFAPQPGFARTKKGRDSPGTPKTRTKAAMVSPLASPKTEGTAETERAGGAGGAGVNAQVGEMGAQDEGGNRSPSQSEAGVNVQVGEVGAQGEGGNRSQSQSEEQGADPAPIQGNGLAREQSQSQSPPPGRSWDHGLDQGGEGSDRADIDVLLGGAGGWGRVG